ncbi:rhomboid family intramembrane serine protease GlpG [Brumicola pallidula]|uniref:GlpG protein n=1 Tax=Brumicola pallidula DSM 14239 = ACAM 615 TaxID=1121922 RepID=K6ZDB7_9ALTE|nr:rhomboid family intramembrane serine protease GlpG [Glaciecola pallidula]GAC26958.1 GlpG protein [Glaciecola pallidula DSM 14239 = ACAM 615]
MSDLGKDSTPILAFSDKKPARLLADYLTSCNIDVRIGKGKPAVSGYDTADVDQESVDKLPDPIETSRYQIIVLNPNDVQEALKIAEDFVTNPNQAKYQQAAWEVGKSIAGSKDSPQRVTAKSAGVPVWLQDLKSTPFMSLVLAICLGVFLLSYLGASNVIYQSLTIRSIDELLQSQQWWRLFTPAFLHFGAIHIIFNLIWWWLLGSQLERAFGSVSLAVIFAIAAISSNVAQLLVSGPNFGGLSGVVYALFGYVWWIGLLRPQWGMGLPNNLVYFLLGWLALGYFDVLWVNMANEAHLFGLISGCLMALATHQLAGNRRPRN